MHRLAVPTTLPSIASGLFRLSAAPRDPGGHHDDSPPGVVLQLQEPASSPAARRRGGLRPALLPPPGRNPYLPPQSGPYSLPEGKRTSPGPPSADGHHSGFGVGAAASAVSTQPHSNRQHRRPVRGSRQSYFRLSRPGPQTPHLGPTRRQYAAASGVSCQGTAMEQQATLGGRFAPPPSGPLRAPHPQRPALTCLRPPAPSCLGLVPPLPKCATLAAPSIETLPSKKPPPS